jgi:hypothetical protein
VRVVAEGLTNAQVARRLHLSEHTVAAHLRSIFNKTGVANRNAATRYALEHGFGSPRPVAAGSGHRRPQRDRTVSRARRILGF